MIFCLSSSLSASQNGLQISPVTYDYTPYEKDEFPNWAMEMRRADTIFFGSLAITLPVSMLVYNIGAQLGMPTPSQQSTAMLYQIGGAAALSLVITGIDWILGMVEKN